MSANEIIKISDFYLNQVKSVLAYPVVPEVHLYDNEIKQLAVWPALYEYFLKFPIQVPEQMIQEVAEMSVPFPDDYTIGLIDLRTVGKTGFGTKQGSNSDFWRVVRFNQEFRGSKFRSGRKGSLYGINPEGLKYNFIAQQQMIDAMTNNLDTFRHEVNYTTKTITVFSTVNAQLLIIWAKTSNDFEQIKPTQRLNVLDLAKANLLRHLASMGSMLTDNGAEKQINVDSLRSEADRIETKVRELWNNIPDVVALRFA